MNYRFATVDENYEDYSSGRVLYNQSGATSFPIRLASEIFQICLNILSRQGNDGPYTVYDPCCGGAYLLTTLALKHGDYINKIYASDVDENMISLANRNLSLISLPGIYKRMEQINELVSLYNKASHLDALRSAENLRSIVAKRRQKIIVNCFAADITLDNVAIEIGRKIDMVITDLPYGNIVNWHGKQSDIEAKGRLLDNIFPVLAKKSVVAVISDKKNSIKHESYKRLEKINIGKRQIVILQPAKL